MEYTTNIKIKMEDFVSKRAEKIYKADILFKVIKEVTGISKNEIISKNRKKDIAIVRNIAGYMLHKDIGMTTTDTAEIIKRDHSTVVYYSKMFETNYDYWRDFKNIYDIVSKYFWSEFTTCHKEELDLQVKSLESLIEKLKQRTEYLLTKNN